MSIQTTAELVRRFADRSVGGGQTPLYPRAVMKKLLAAATSGHVAVWRLSVFRHEARSSDERVIALGPPVVRATWPEVVFHYNGAALGEVERVTEPSACYAVELLAREAYFAGRTHLALDERGEDELEWELHSLSSSLALAEAMAEVRPTPLDLERLTTLRTVIAARRGNR